MSKIFVVNIDNFKQFLNKYVTESVRMEIEYRLIECGVFESKDVILLDRIEEAIDKIGELDSQSIEFHEGTNHLGTSEFVCVDEVLEILNKLIAEVKTSK